MDIQEEAADDLEKSINKFAKELLNDTHLDELRLIEIELKIPNVKAKWSMYYAVNKAKLNRLKTELEDVIESNIDNVMKFRAKEGNPVSAKGAENIIRKSKKVKELENRIKKMEILCEYLGKNLEVVIKNLNWDVRNVVDTRKLDEIG